MLGYFKMVVWVVVPLLLAVVLIGTDYIPERYEQSKFRHSGPTQSLATAPPSAPDTTLKAALAAQPKAQSAPDIRAKFEPTAEAAPEVPAKVEPAAQAEPEEPAKVEPTAEAAPEIPAKIESAAQAEPEEPAKFEPTAEAASEIPAKVEPAAQAEPEKPAKVESAARAPRAQSPSRKKQSQNRHHQQGNPQETEIVPSTWRALPQDGRIGGRHYVSPDGSSLFAAWATSVHEAPVATHMNALASADGERVTYHRRERDWLAVSGFRGDKIFYRKAVIACGGTVWHHIEFEYPASRKREMDPFVVRASRAIDRAENDNCLDNRKVEPAAEAAPEIPAKTESAAQAEPGKPAKVEPAVEAAPEIPAKIESAAGAPIAQAPSRKKQSQKRRAAQSTSGFFIFVAPAAQAESEKPAKVEPGPLLVDLH